MTQDKGGARGQAIRELYQRGITAMRQGRYDEAVADFDQVLALDPNQPEARAALNRAKIALAKSTK